MNNHPRNAVVNNHRLKVMALSALLATAVLSSASHGADVDTVLKAGADKVTAARLSQQRVDSIADETSEILQDFRMVNKQIEGLKVYNDQLDRQIANQGKTLSELQESIANATVLERQILPLTIRMLDALEQFVRLDVPFNQQSRLDAIAKVRANLDNPRFSSAEKFRQVLEVYDIEGQYSRTIEQFDGMLEVAGEQRRVTFFRVGRVAFMYQTTDQEQTGVWDARAGKWQEANDYRADVAKGIRIARKQAAVDILTLPIPAPETAQ